MKSLSETLNDDENRFLFSNLPATLQAEVSKKLPPKDFGNLLQTSKEVQTSIKKYARSTCRDYFFKRTHNIVSNQQRIIEDFLDSKPIKRTYALETTMILNLDINQKAIDIIRKIHKYNLENCEKATIQLLPTEIIEKLIDKIKENKKTIKLHNSLRDYRSRSGIPCPHTMCLIATVRRFFFITYSILCTVSGLLLIAGHLIASLIIISVPIFHLVAITIVTLNNKFKDLQDDDLIEDYKNKMTLQKNEISRLVEELDRIFSNATKESTPTDINNKEKVLEASSGSDLRSETAQYFPFHRNQY